MAKRDPDGVPKKPYSSKLLQMKFMQRGNKARAAAATPTDDQDRKEAEVAQVSDEGQWVSSRGQEAGCQVIFEGDPVPGSCSGRISFSGVPATEATHDGASQKEEGTSQGAVVAAPALAEPIKSEQEQPAPKKRKKASSIKGERFDSPKIDMKGRYFVS